MSPRLSLFTDPVFEEHETGAHPECAARLRSVRRRLEADGLLDDCRRVEIRGASIEELTRIHPAEYVRHVQDAATRGGGRLDPDTVVSPRSFDVAVQAAGSACAAVDEVLSGDTTRALVLARPPGHHALASRAMGFCLFNNVAVAAAHARHGHHLERVLIVDWDVHHGNGTQDLFYDDGQVAFFSAHRYPFYPGTGSADQTGSGAGLGFTRNLPLAFGISRADYLARFTQQLETFADKVRPELVLLSAGFDAHALDPIGSLGLDAEDFVELTQLVADVARQHAGGRLVSLLEGGYHLEALAECVSAHVATLSGERP